MLFINKGSIILDCNKNELLSMHKVANENELIRDPRGSSPTLEEIVLAYLKEGN
ncbi:hypothetical protein D3C75_1216830 [compost metagenome]